MRERTQRFGTGTRVARARNNPRAVRGGPIHVRLALGNSAVPVLRIFPAQAGLLGSVMTCTAGVFFFCDLPTQPPGGWFRALFASFADLVNEGLISAVPIPLLHQPLGFRLALIGP